MDNEPVLLGIEDDLSFGKYDGRSIEWVLENDREYLVWLLEKGIVIFTEDVESYL